MYYAEGNLWVTISMTCNGQTAYFSLILSFIEYGVTAWDPYNSEKVERVQRQAARFVKSRYSDALVFLICLMCWGLPHFSQRRQEARIILFYKIINGLAQVPFKGILVEAYNLRVLEENTI